MRLFCCLFDPCIFHRATHPAHKRRENVVRSGVISWFYVRWGLYAVVETSLFGVPILALLFEMSVEAVHNC